MIPPALQQGVFQHLPLNSRVPFLKIRRFSLLTCCKLLTFASHKHVSLLGLRCVKATCSPQLQTSRPKTIEKSQVEIAKSRVTFGFSPAGSGPTPTGSGPTP